MGHGNEKNNWLPKPVRIPTIQGVTCIPVEISLGFCHTVIIAKSSTYSKIPDICETQVKIEELEPLKTDNESENITEKEEVIQTPPKFESIVESSPEVKSPVIEVKNIVIEEKVKEEKFQVLQIPSPMQMSSQKTIRSLKDILQSREDRRYCLVCML